MKKVLALIVLCFIAFNSHAQLKYQNGYLVYNAYGALQRIYDQLGGLGALLEIWESND